MKRYIFFGILVFIVLGVALAPAGVLTRWVPENSEIQTLNARGTIWRGQTDLIIGGRPIGTVRWSPRLTSLLRLSPGTDWELDQALASVSGYLSHDGTTLSTTANGTADAEAFADWLQTYDISLPGRFTFEDIRVDVATETQSITALDGALKWSGGRVRYILSGILDQADLPPMVAYLETSEDRPRAEVFAQGTDVPLLIMEPSDDGFVKISLTKRFTKLLNRPWPGSDPDHAVVLSVEEKLL